MTFSGGAELSFGELKAARRRDDRVFLVPLDGAPMAIARAFS